MSCFHRRKRDAMCARYAERFQCGLVRGSAVSLVLREAIARQLRVQFDHHTVTRHLGEDGRARNRKRKLIAVNDRFLGQRNGEEPERVKRLDAIGARMRKELTGMGFNIGNSVSPIIPILIGDNPRTLLAWKTLFEAGVFVNPILSPAVPPGMELLRTSYMASHTDEQIDRVLQVYREVGKQLALIP